MRTGAEECRPASFPLATYRLQFHRCFTFADARAIVPYLHGLGITDCYLSPISKAVPGSDHGYDVIDPTVFNPELGTDEEFAGFVSAVKAHGMGLILDVVPNHMGIARALNRWWFDVLENGPSSRYASAFDIDWHPIKRELENKVLLPILPDQYGTVLERQDMQITYEEGSFILKYADYRLPLAPKSWIGLLSYRLERLTEDSEPRMPVLELQSILTAIRNLPNRHEQDSERIAEAYREKEVIKKRLAALLESNEGIRIFVMDNVRMFNGEKGRPDSVDLLDAMLNDQAYRLASWKVASEEINYRRFFDINELAAIRMEEETVFQDTHQLLRQLARDRALRGCRIDHVDGLYDPARYLTRLRELTEPDQSRVAAPFFIVVEKILGRGERLPDWPIQGTTGYDFLNQVNGLFVASINEKALSELYTKVLDRERMYADLAYDSKQLILRASMASELNVLGNQLNQISEGDRRSRDFTLNNLTHALREIIACFPVYRTYVAGGSTPVAERDCEYIQKAVAQAKRRNPATSGEVFDFVRSILLKQRKARNPEDLSRQIQFIMKFQQITGPVMAKGMEDTVFYRYHRLISLNEVGGDPEYFGMPVEDFHQCMRERQARWPSTLSASSTHDTKRSEDARARINVLSELPGEWKRRVNRWKRLNRRHRRETEGELIPDSNDEYLFYQTLIGVWPFEPMDEDTYGVFCERIHRYMRKAVKEAKVHTSWINPNPAYDHALEGFVRAALDRAKVNRFLEDFLPFQARVARYGLYNSLSQLLVKLTAPGIPDVFQGTELWSLHLVDPDNRGPIDYDVRMAMVRHLRHILKQLDWNRAQFAHSLLEQAHDGRIKLYIIMMSLDYRRLHPDLFQRGEYVPLVCEGSKRQHVCAFARIHEEKALVTVVPRLVALLSPDRPQALMGSAVWENSCIALPWPKQSEFRHLFTGEIVGTEPLYGRWVLPLAKIFQHCSVALLERLA